MRASRTIRTSFFNILFLSFQHLSSSFHLKGCSPTPFKTGRQHAVGMLICVFIQSMITHKTTSINKLLFLRSWWGARIYAGVSNHTNILFQYLVFIVSTSFFIFSFKGVLAHPFITGRQHAVGLLSLEKACVLIACAIRMDTRLRLRSTFKLIGIFILYFKSEVPRACRADEPRLRIKLRRAGRRRMPWLQAQGILLCPLILRSPP